MTPDLSTACAALGIATLVLALSAIIARWGGRAQRQDSDGRVLFDARWYAGANVLGTSTLFKLLQPGRTPVVGVDSGGTLTYAAFWTVAVPNDGDALGS